MIYIAIVFVSIIAIYSGYLIWNAIHFGAMQRFDDGELNATVSVIIPARNEEVNIAELLSCLQKQDYPADLLEIIVVDDHSNDNTAAVVEGFLEDERIRLLSSPARDTNSFKKAAIAHGIEQSNGEIIITTDADCRMGRNWLSSTVAAFSSDTQLVSGPVLLTTNGSWFQQFQSLEFMGLIAVGGGSMAAGFPNMCNGANLAYRRSAYQSVNGFQGIDNIASGDDELLMHKIAQKFPGKIRFNKKKEAIVKTAALQSWKSLRAQRKRWVSKSRNYSNKFITILLSIIYFGMLGFPVLLAAGLFDPTWWIYLTGMLVIKTLGELTVLGFAASFFGKLPLLFYLPAEQFAHIAYILWVGVAGNSGTFTWKGREVR